MAFFMDFFLITSSIVLKRSCLEKAGFFNEDLQVGEDFEFFLRLAISYKAGVIKEKMFLRRVYKNSLSKQDYELNRSTDIRTLQSFIEKYHDFYRQNKKKIDQRLRQLYIKFGYAHLDHGHNFKAFKWFLLASKFKKRLTNLKYYLLCLIPTNLRKAIQKYHGKK